MNTAMREYLLLDGALVRGLVDCTALLADPATLSIYADLGAEAAAVGPILTTQDRDAVLRSEALAEAGAIERRHWRYGHALLRTQADEQGLGAHLRERRYLKTRDGQRFFLRYADARALLALWPALTGSQRADLLGPIAQWTVHDARGAPVTLEAAGLERPAASATLVLRPAALDQLTQAMWTWNLLAAAEEVDASLVERETDADSLAWCEQASALANAPTRCSFAVETMVAVALLRSRGWAVESASFADALKEARFSSDTRPLQRWIEADVSAPEVRP
jgi:hypothetical protein